jgi:hypothetical protein
VKSLLQWPPTAGWFFFVVHVFGVKQVAFVVPKIIGVLAAGYARIAQVGRDLVGWSRDTAVTGDGDRAVVSV